MWTKINSFVLSLYARATVLRREEGQTLVEYALIIALVSVALVGVLQLLTGALTGVFEGAKTALESA